MSQGRALLLILGGAGFRTESRGNAVTDKNLPTLFRQMHEAGFALLDAAGDAVGLEAGQVGNSEVGHLSLGAGEVVDSMVRRLLHAYEDGSWAAHPVWTSLGQSQTLHIVGLLSDAGVHALSRTLVQASHIASRKGIREILIHPVFDGVDSQTGSAPALLDELRAMLGQIPQARLGVVQGRQHFLDDSGDLAKTRIATNALCGYTDLEPFDLEELREHLDDEQCESTFPAMLVPGGRAIQPGENVLLTNHLAEGVRQIGTVLSDSQPLYSVVDLGSFEGHSIPTADVFFPQPPRTRGLAFELRRHGIPSLRIADSSKLPHVTHFFNGLDPAVEGQGECIDSTAEKGVRQQPGLSSREVTDRIIAAMQHPGRRAIIANMADLDQAGHTGDLKLCKTAAKAIDKCYQRLVEAAKENGFTILVTADHGNADTMLDEHGQPSGSHTAEPVPFVIQPAPNLRMEWQRKKGALANVASTYLEALGVRAPRWMAPSLARIRSR
ncbi:MAG: hypothetical protein VYE77_07260 [Planctomycetota bacterium]|nr:hypothetical protein [Planctomycetota bacterium]